MKRATLICGAVACVLLQACGAAPGVQVPVQRQPLSMGQAVWIDINNGTLDISNQGSAEVEVSGQASQGETVQVTPGADGVHITSKAPSRPFWKQGTPVLDLNIRVPNGAFVHINTFEAEITIHDFAGGMIVTAVAGDISVRNSQGDFEIKSNRGNVTVEATSGTIHLAGNYGVLSIIHTRGTSDASTIMGTVRFSGTISAGDQVSLETDHGPVEIQLGSTSDVTVKMGTTSGVVTCMMPGLHYDGQACTGTLRAGEGQLQVRTVSGSATLEQLP